MAVECYFCWIDLKAFDVLHLLLAVELLVKFNVIDCFNPFQAKLITVVHTLLHFSSTCLDRDE